MSTPALSALENRFRQIAALEAASGILHWDAATMLPSGSSGARAEQLAALAEVAHEKLTDPKLTDLFEKAKTEQPGDAWRRDNLREMLHRYAHATAVPQPLVSALTKLRITSEHLWREAKAKADYAMFLPTFREVVALTREVANAKANVLHLSPYDALLDSYDPGLRNDFVAPLFADLKSWLPGFVGEAIEAQRKQFVVPLEADIPTAKQELLGREMMKALGFDTTQGRIDTSAHPFCGGAPGDCRITTRYREDRFTDALYGVVHETGHALYEQGLPAEWRGLPIGEARGMAMHESQSLFIEMQLCRSPAFLAFLLPRLKKTFGVSGPAWELANVQQALTRVERSFIRVNADEVTYPLHVIMRWELEQALLSGDLPVEDLPAAWAEKTRTYLDITPPNDAEGCLQDIHWPEGMFGYFPTYTLGAMIAAQLMHRVRIDLPGLDGLVEKGEFAPLLGWLRTHVHRHGSEMSTGALVEKATGEKLNPSIYQAHLKARYLPG